MIKNVFEQKHFNQLCVSIKNLSVFDSSDFKTVW